MPYKTNTAHTIKSSYEYALLKEFRKLIYLDLTFLIINVKMFQKGFLLSAYNITVFNLRHRKECKRRKNDTVREERSVGYIL